MFCIVGSGLNGKGVLLNILQAAFGDYATTIHNSVLRRHSLNPNAPTPALAALAGKRLIACSEFPKNTRLEEPLVKNLTGSDIISFRQNYGDQETFKAQGTIILTTNDFPRVDFKNDAMWRRLYPIPFRRRFAGPECDFNLEDRLKQELSGILNWLIEGAVRYHREGKIPQAKTVENYLIKLRHEIDSVGNWVKECCTPESDARLPSSEAYASYQQFTKSNQADPVSSKEFKHCLQEKGFSSKRTRHGVFFCGLRLKLF